ncbi:low density lipoprotein receptor adapter protein 1-like isoform X2 [Mercenaria mercenaria]|uniref:low density lipoprotein receptor adapter protein 1-like isoform X2 n=1 Tax=Mercenaria mercenaria TaxID=6596 RepID=UPI00234E9B5F|nr:low density lipoprotein receptor adapter protein 1-like isoform X2 [Mercenaria mercenaria]
MESLFRKVRKSPQAGKHSKLGEGWDVNREAVTEGVAFYLKYLGSTLLDELPHGESYGEGVSSRAVQRIVDMARTQGRKLNKVNLKVSPSGIKVTDMDSKQLLMDVSIYRISFCTADRNHDKLFAFIARNSINETMECHAFYCAKEKIAQAVTISVSQAFNLAKDQWEKAKNLKNSQQNTNVRDENHAMVEHTQVPPVPPRKIQSAPQINLLSETHPRLPKPESARTLYTNVQSSSPRQGWQTFDESAEDNQVSFNLCEVDNDNLDDCFSQLAENRSRKQSFPSFSTDLRQEDLDENVADYLDGKKCFEAFSRTKSLEDLMNI